MRTEKELFELMLRHQDFFESGLCDWILDMWGKVFISDKEYWLLKKYLRKNKPDGAESFWWENGELQPRINWINEQIEKL